MPFFGVCHPRRSKDVLMWYFNYFKLSKLCLIGCVFVLLSVKCKAVNCSVVTCVQKRVDTVCESVVPCFMLNVQWPVYMRQQKHMETLLNQNHCLPKIL